LIGCVGAVLLAISCNFYRTAVTSSHIIIKNHFYLSSTSRTLRPWQNRSKSDPHRPV
jgi:hypothetical protein